MTDKNEKKATRIGLIKALKTQISSIIEKEHQKDEFRQYIKQDVDKEILTICNHV